jgi:Tfp pilus assembly protein PilF
MWKQKNNIIFIVLLMLISLGVIYSFIQTREEITRLNFDTQVYQAAQGKLQSGNYEQAITLYSSLLNKVKNQKSPTLNWEMAYCYKKSGDFTQAARYYERTRMLYPAVVINPGFIKEYAEVLFLARDYAKCRVYLERLRIASQIEDDRSWADQMLTIIETESAKGDSIEQ